MAIFRFLWFLSPSFHNIADKILLTFTNFTTVWNSCRICYPCYIYLLFILYIQHTAFIKLFFVKLWQKFASKFLLQLAILVEFNLLFLLCNLLFLLNYTFPLAVFLSLKLGKKTCKQIFVTECNPGHKCGHREGEQNGIGNIATKLTIIQKRNPNNLDNIIRF